MTLDMTTRKQLLRVHHWSRSRRNSALEHLQTRGGCFRRYPSVPFLPAVSP